MSKRFSKSQYVVADASDDSDDSMDVQMTAKDFEEEARMNKAMEAHDRRIAMLTGRSYNKEMTAEEEALLFEQRHASGNIKEAYSDDGHYGGNYAEEARYSNNFLPKQSDPKVFSVRCNRLMGRVLVARILNKCHAYRNGLNFEKKKIDLGIISVFSIDHVKEFIYLESYQESHVRQALQGLEGVFRYKISVIDSSELMTLMERQVTGKETVVEGNFVRLRRFPYRGDLAKVVKVEDCGRRVTCITVPREDFVGKSYVKHVKGAVRHPQRFFMPDQAVGVRELASGEYRWGDALTFTGDGYLLVESTLRMLMVGKAMEKPTVEELAMFFRNDREKVLLAQQQLLDELNSSATVDFKVDDVVRAHSQIDGAVGKITDISYRTNTATILYHSSKGDLSITLSMNDISRYFPEGSHLIVERGIHKGKGGTVIRVDGHSLAIVTDVDAIELHCRANDCRMTQLAAPAEGHGTRNDDFRLFDLISLCDGSALCCVCRIFSTHVEVIDKHNTVRSIQKTDIRNRVMGRPAFDMYRNRVSRNDEVSIEGGVSKNLIGTTGTVAQVFNDTVFIQSKRLSARSGIVAVPIKLTRLVGGKSKTQKTTVLKMMKATVPQLFPPRDPKLAKAGKFEVNSSVTWESLAAIDDDNGY